MKKLLLSLAAMALGMAANATVVTFDLTSGYENAQEVTTVTKDGVTITFDKGTNNNTPKYYNSGTAVRCYGGNFFTIASASENINLVEFTFGASDGTNAITANVGTFNSPNWTGSAKEVTFTIGGTTGNRRFAKITVTYGEEGAQPDQPTEPDTPTGTITVAEALALMADGFEGTATVKGVISEITEVSASYGNGTYTIKDALTDAKGLLVYRGYWLNGDKFTDANQIAVGGTVVVEGSLVNFNGTYEFTTGSKIVEYTAPEGGQTPEQPEQPTGTLTVAEALAKMAEGFEGNATVKGIISEVSELSTSYGNATYTIKDALTDAAGLLVYRGYWLNGDKFTAENQIEVGGTVVVEGKLVNYNGTYEFTTGSKIVEYTAPQGGGETPEQPSEPTGNNVTFDFTNPALFGYTAEGDEIVLTDETLTSGVISMECTAAESASNFPRYFCSSAGAWTFRFYKDNTIYVNAEDGCKITAIVFKGTNLSSNITYTEGSLVGSTWTAKNTEGVESMSFTKTATGNNPTIQTMTVYYNGSSSIENVVSENAPVEYFNLQGVRVANPENGLYIRRQGNNVSKVLVK